MKKSETQVKKLLLATLIAVLFIPLLQFKINVIKEKKLEGDIQKTEKFPFTEARWFSGFYQDNILSWFNEEFGFRATAVRLRNQVSWEMNHEARTKEVVVGKENWLYEKNYILAYTGKDFKGEAHWSLLTNKLKQLQDTLAKENVTIIVAIAPGKASFYPEYIPSSFGPASEKTNYKSFSSDLAAHNINFVDFNSWFLQMKKNTPFPLYSKGGIHWSRYGSTLALDSLLKYMKKKTGTNLSQIKIKNVKFADTIGRPDNDIADAMNLLFPLPPTKMAYPEIEVEKGDTANTPGLFVVADSYFWQLYSEKLAPSIFKNVKFSYYNKQLFDSDNIDFWQWVNPNEVPFDTKQNNILLLLVTEANLPAFPWGFLEKINTDLYPETNVVARNRKIVDYENKIRYTPEWLKEVVLKAKANKVSVDSMIKADAMWMLNNEEKGKK